MRFLLGGFGSRGDVQPMLALALALRDRGHAVTFVATSDFEGWAKDLNLPFVSCGLSMQATLEQAADEGLQMLRAAREFVRGHFRLLQPLVPDCDVVVASSMTAAGASLAEKFGKRYHAVWMCPQAVPSAHHGPPNWSSSPAVNKQDLPRWVNRAAWSIYVRSSNAFMLGEPINSERARLGLPPVGDAYRHMVLQRLLLACDPVLAPLPPDVADQATQTGAWFLPETGALPAEVEAFLAAGPPPVYAGLGSMPDEHPRRTARTLLEAAQRAGARLLLSRGWAGLGGIDLPPTALAIGATPHGQLFPRCAAVVHHGGAGTTATAARAGVPQVVVPHYADQFYWAHRAWKLGIGPEPVPKVRLRADRLAEALRRCLGDEALRARAAALASEVRTDGVRRAVEIVEGAPRARSALLA